MTKSLWNKIVGRIIYEVDWYARVEFPSDFGRYLRALAKLNRRSLRLSPPEGGTHITLVKRERPPNEEFWGKYEGYEVSVYYCVEVGNNKDAYYWLSMNPVFLYEIRKELGLPKYPRGPLHLSYGVDSDVIELRKKELV